MACICEEQKRSRVVCKEKSKYHAASPHLPVPTQHPFPDNVFLELSIQLMFVYIVDTRCCVAQRARHFLGLNSGKRIVYVVFNFIRTQSIIKCDLI